MEWLSSSAYGGLERQGRMGRLTVVNDNPELLDLIAEIVDADRHVTTLIGQDQDDLVPQICRSRPDVVIIDLRHGEDGRHGWEIAQQLRSTTGNEELPVVLCSDDSVGLAEVEPELRAAAGVAALNLPFGIDELLQSIRSLIGRREALRCS